MIPSTRPDAQLSANFWLSEFEQSETATRLGLRNEADLVALKNLKRLAMHGEDVRVALGNNPVVVSSGLRTLIVNGLVKHLITAQDVPILGKRPDLMDRLRKDPSAHRTGCAMDFTVPKYGSPRSICRRLAESSLQFDQLIFEGTWVHYGIAEEGKKPRREVLTAIFEPGKKPRYLPGVL